MASTIPAISLWKSDAIKDDDEYRFNYFCSLESFCDSESYIDCVLIIDGQKIPCHKVVLAAASPYFHAMFTCGLKESRQREIEIKGFSFETVSLIIDYIYSGQLYMEGEDLGSVLLAASMFQLERLEKLCFGLIKEDMDPVKAISVYHFCRMNGSVFTEIEEVSKSAILRKFHEIYLREELDILYFKELHDLISDEDLMVKTEWQVVQCILQWVKNKRAKEELTEEHICCLIKALHFDRLTSVQVDSMKRHEVLHNTSTVLAILNNLPVQQEATYQSDQDNKSLRSCQQSMKSLFAGIFLTNESLGGTAQIPSKALDITCEPGKLFTIASPDVHDDIDSEECHLGILEASKARPSAKPYWLIIDKKFLFLQLYVYEKFENVWIKEFESISVPKDADILTSTVCKDYLMCIIKDNTERSSMLYCICLLSGKWIKKNLEINMKPAKFDSPAIVSVEEYIYIIDVRKIGTFKFNINSVISSPTGKIQLMCCSSMPAAPMETQIGEHEGYISAVLVQGKIYSMYSKDFFLEYRQLSGYRCPKVCIYDPVMNSWETMGNTPAFSTLACTNNIDPDITRSDWKKEWYEYAVDKISFSKLISDGNELFLYHHQNLEREDLIKFGNYLYALFKYNMKEKCWTLFEKMPNLLQEVDSFYKGKNIIFADIIPAGLDSIEAEEIFQGNKSTYGNIKGQKPTMFRMNAGTMEVLVQRKLRNRFT